MIDIKKNHSPQHINSPPAVDADESLSTEPKNNSGNDFMGMNISGIDNTSWTASSTNSDVWHLKARESAADDAIEDMIIWMTVREKNNVNRSPHAFAALSGAQQASHSTERQRMRMMKKEKRKSTDRRRRNRGPANGIERRRSNRRIDRI